MTQARKQTSRKRTKRKPPRVPPMQAQVVEGPTTVTMPAQFAQELLNYLAEQPYRQVAHLVQGLIGFANTPQVEAPVPVAEDDADPDA